MKKLFLTVIVFGLTACVNAGEPDKEFHEKCLYPAVMIAQMPDPEPKADDPAPSEECPEDDCHAKGTANNCVACGSGVIFKSEKSGDQYDNYVLTCNHVLAAKRVNFHGFFGLMVDPKSYLVRKANYKDWSTFVGFTDFESDVVYRNKDADIAVLHFVSTEEMPTSVLDMDPKLYIGNDVFRVGCGLSEVMKVDYGKITAVHHDSLAGLKGVFRTSIPTIMGDSGGPTFHKTEDGYKCFGIAQAIRGGKTESYVPLSRGQLAVPVPYFVFHISFVLPVNKVPDLMEKIQKKISPVEAPIPKSANAQP